MAHFAESDNFLPNMSKNIMSLHPFKYSSSHIIQTFIKKLTYISLFINKSFIAYINKQKYAIYIYGSFG